MTYCTTTRCIVGVRGGAEVGLSLVPRRLNALDFDVDVRPAAG